MATREKLIPQDSEERPRKVKGSSEMEKAKRGGAPATDMGDPATKRKYSEQPPTKRNAKT